jgi:hypothetical protein
MTDDECRVGKLIHHSSSVIRHFCFFYHSEERIRIKSQMLLSIGQPDVGARPG